MRERSVIDVTDSKRTPETGGLLGNTAPKHSQDPQDEIHATISIPETTDFATVPVQFREKNADFQTGFPAQTNQFATPKQVKDPA